MDFDEHSRVNFSRYIREDSSLIELAFTEAFSLLIRNDIGRANLLTLSNRSLSLVGCSDEFQLRHCTW